MIRAIAVVLILWGQLIAGCLQGNLVLCVHADGSTAIELASALCCDVDLGCSESFAVDCCGEGDEQRFTDDGGGDCCQDFLLQSPQLTFSPSVTTADHQDHQPVVAHAAPAATAPVVESPALRSPTPGDRGPPGPDIVRRCLRSVQLRC